MPGKKYPRNYRYNKKYEQALKDLFDDNASSPVTIKLIDGSIMKFRIYAN